MSVATALARARVRSMSTTSRATPRITEANAHAQPPLPAPTIPSFIRTSFPGSRFAFVHFVSCTRRATDGIAKSGRKPARSPSEPAHGMSPAGHRVSTNVTVGFEDGLGVYQLGLGGSHSHAHRVNGGVILPGRAPPEGQRPPHRHARNLPPEATPGDGLLGKQRRNDLALLIIQPDRPRLTPAVRFSRGASAPPPHSGCSPYGAGQPRPSEGLG